MRRFLMGTLAAAVLFAAGNWWGMAAAKGNASAGQGLFTRCVPCHGKDGSGNTPMGKNVGTKDLRSQEVQKLSDDEIAAVIAKGKGKMPTYEKILDGGKIQDLVAYVRTLKAK